MEASDHRNDAGPAPTRVALFVTCVVDVLQPEVGEAAVQVLRAAGCDVSYPAGQTCCGQPAWNSGFTADAARVARTTLDALEASDAEVIACPAGSCTTMVRVFWPELFELVGDHDAAARARALGGRVRELTELLAERRLPPMRRSAGDVVAYHRSCHMLRELHIDAAPTDLLAQVEGCEVAEWPAADRCCGFGGLFSMKLPEASVAIADDKLDSVPAEVGTIVGADSSCLLHLRGRAAHEGRALRTMHVAEVLAEALGEAR